MKSILSACLFLYVSLLMSCDNSQTESTLPACIQEKITEIKNESVRNPPAQVWEWKDAGKVYYYITSDCCDQLNFLFDSNCSIVCSPDGGFTGTGNGDCPEFTKSIEKKLLWKDDRGQ